MKTGGSPKQLVEPAFLCDDRLRLLLFGGKGGVGKTTCAAATALTLAQRHPERLFLLVSTDPAHSLLDCFGGAAPPENLTLSEIDPQDSLKRFKAEHQMHLRTIALRGTFLDDADITNFLDISMPGLDEIMALLEIAAWIKQNRYACIVVDTAPAGHTLRLLGLPEIMQQWVNTLDAMLDKHRYLTRLYRGVYHKDAVDLYLEQTLSDLSNLGALLQSHELCRFVPVMTAEAMSIHVTRTMLGELEQLALPVRDLIVNRLRPAQEDCPFCSESVARQAVAIAKLAQVFSDYNLWGLPLFLDEMQGSTRLLSVWQNTRPLAQWHFAPMNGALSASAPGVQPVNHPVPLPDPSKKLILFAGKGGVGKTTLACASALYFAQLWSEKKILLFSIDPANSLATCMGHPVGPQEVQVAPGLSVIELDAAAEYARLKQEYSDELRSVFDRDTGQIDLAFDREVMERILDMAPPGLDEVLALTRIVEMMESGRYDLFVLDTAPTGHLLRFLEMPELIEQWLKTFFALFLKYREIFWLPKISQMMINLSRQLKLFRRVLLDAKQAMLVAVAIPTGMACEETKDLAAACVRLGVAVPTLLVNMVTRPSSCPVCSMLHRTEERVLEQYDAAFPDLHRAWVFYQKEPRGIDRLRALGQALYVASNSTLSV
jgi:arsenite-transporting ATPase